MTNNPIDKKDLVRMRVIELIHGCEYEEAVGKELVNGCKVVIDKITVRVVSKNYAGNFVTVWDLDGCSIHRTVKSNKITSILGLPITLGRLLKATDVQNQSLTMYNCGLVEVSNGVDKGYTSFYWLFTLPNGQEATLDDQTPETIDSLYQLLIPNEQ